MVSQRDIVDGGSILIQTFIRAEIGKNNVATAALLKKILPKIIVIFTTLVVQNNHIFMM